MQIDAERVTALRKKCSWSQDELATAAGLKLRTIQRVENAGTASLQTLKAIAAALDTDLEDLRKPAEKVMTKFEYKTLELKFKTGFINQVSPDITTALNKEGRDGWRLSEIFTPTGSSGQSISVIAILERPLG